MKPVLLLVPGMFNTAEVWQPIAEILQPELDIRIADVSIQASMFDMARDAWNLVADLPAGTPLTVCGFSMGGYVAIELLAAHQTQVHAAAFVDTSARVETAESTLVREKTIAALERNFDKAVEGTISFSLHPDNLQNTALVDGMRRMLHAVGAQTAIRQVRAIIARSDHRAMLARLAIPTLVACGRQDKVTPPEFSEDLARLIPGARLVWIEQAGHQTPREQPAALGRLLLSLVQDAATRNRETKHKETP